MMQLTSKGFAFYRQLCQLATGVFLVSSGFSWFVPAFRWRYTATCEGLELVTVTEPISELLAFGQLVSASWVEVFSYPRLHSRFSSHPSHVCKASPAEVVSPLRRS